MGTCYTCVGVVGEAKKECKQQMGQEEGNAMGQTTKSMSQSK